MYQAADYPAQTHMEPKPPTPLDSPDGEQRIADLTGMTPESSQTYMDFHTGMRWLRRDPE